MHYKQELQNALTEADKNYGSFIFIVVLLLQLEDFILAELRTEWAAQGEVGRAWGARGGDQVPGSCSPPSLAEAEQPPGASPPSPPPPAPLGGAPARKVAG